MTEKTDKPEPAAGPTERPMSWRELVSHVLGLGSTAEAMTLLAVVEATAGKDGATVPVEAIAERLDVKPSTVSALLPKFTDAGWLNREAVLEGTRAKVVFRTARAVR